MSETTTITAKDVPFPFVVDTSGFPSELREWFEELAKRQQPLDREIAQALNEDFWEII